MPPSSAFALIERSSCQNHGRCRRRGDVRLPGMVNGDRESPSGRGQIFAEPVRLGVLIDLSKSRSTTARILVQANSACQAFLEDS